MSHTSAPLRPVWPRPAAQPAPVLPGGVPRPRSTWALLSVAVVVCSFMVWAALRWPLDGIGLGALTDQARDLGGAAAADPGLHPALELLKLAGAAFIGLLVMAVNRCARRERPLGRSMEQAQILLCVSGALMMLIIGNSLARAFGIAGAASIIRFRTPVDDPKDVTILFLVMGLGMACGLGAFALAGLGALFLSLLLLTLDLGRARAQRALTVELTSAGREFPTAHVRRVFERHGVAIEPRGWSQGEATSVTYHASFDPALSLEALSHELLGGGACGLRSVSWGSSKKAA